MKRVIGLYFSPTKNTEKIVKSLSEYIAKKLNIKLSFIDFTDKDVRSKTYKFSKEELIVVGLPTIAGRVPNLMLEFLKSLEFDSSLTVCVTTFGNRNYDDSLRELADICSEVGANVIGAGAFVGEHSFSNILGAKRPDEKDMIKCMKLAEAVCSKIFKEDSLLSINDKIKGRTAKERQYFRPLDDKGKHIDIRKVKPVTSEECDNCMWCVLHCPLKSINRENPKDVNGVCMKCCSCVKGCHKQAKSFEDKGFLYHKKDLERKYTHIRKESEIFI